MISTPLAPGAAPPNTSDLNLFDGTRPLRTVPAAAVAVPAPEPPRRRRRGVLFVAAGAVVAVVGAAGWAAGMFSYETPSRDGAAPKDVRESVPDVSGTPSASLLAEASPTAPVSSSAPSEAPSASASPSGSASASASPSESAPTPSSSPSEAATPSSAPPTSAPAEAPTEEEADDGTGPVLRRGTGGRRWSSYSSG
ncbi:hypothetical protein SHKM778_74880 [Streptomyces sp. KM77-8]|uniref:Serine/threonine protein kinase n=1 Tax=Streptomyces haneummycinicus TaxID=3074435 RepID=A0AAT9HUC7_9ACTN